MPRPHPNPVVRRTIVIARWLLIASMVFAASLAVGLYLIDGRWESPLQFFFLSESPTGPSSPNLAVCYILLAVGSALLAGSIASFVEIILLLDRAEKSRQA